MPSEETGLIYSSNDSPNDKSDTPEPSSIQNAQTTAPDSTFNSFIQNKLDAIPDLFVYEIFASFCYCCWTFFQPASWGQLLTWYPAFTTGVTVYVIIVMNNTTAVVHFNPAITLSFYVSGELSAVKSIWYVIAQCIGGLHGWLKMLQFR